MASANLDTILECAAKGLVEVQSEPEHAPVPDYDKQADIPVQENMYDQLPVAEETLNGPVVTSLGGFIHLTFPPRVALLDKLLYQREILMLCALRGVGKSRFASYMALCLATGSTCLKWPAPCPLKTLYIDGELTGDLLQKRWPEAIRDAGVDANLAETNLHVLSKYTQHNQYIPSLGSAEGRGWLLEAAKGFEVVFLDSLLTLFHLEDIRTWEKKASVLNDTLIALRDTGVGVVIIQHANKNGEQHGSVHNESYVANSIQLKEVVDETPIQGCHFSLTFMKKREVMGEDAEALDVKLENNTWSFSVLKASEEERILDMYLNLGMTQQEIARELKLDQSTVCRKLQQNGVGRKYRAKHKG